MIVKRLQTLSYDYGTSPQSIKNYKYWPNINRIRTGFFKSPSKARKNDNRYATLVAPIESGSLDYLKENIWKSS